MARLGRPPKPKLSPIDTTTPHLSKAQVIENWGQGLYRTYPELWIPHAIGETLDEWQIRTVRKLFLGEKHQVSVRAGHGVGKTYLSSRITLQFLMNYTPSLAVATGPTGKQTRSQYWSSLCIATQKSVFRDDIECLATRIFIKGQQAKEEWKALWVPCKDPRTLEGFHGPVEGQNLLWVTEEAKAVPDPVFESLSGALSNENCFLYEASTCGPPRGQFFDSHTRLRHQFDTEHIPSTESPRVSPEKIQRWKEQWGEDSPVYRARVLAEFPEEDDSAIASLSWLTRAIENSNDDEDLAAA